MDGILCIVAMFFTGFLLSSYQCQILQTNSVHRTPAAERPANDLWCYRCEATDDNDNCVDLKGNSTQHHFKCKDDKRICIIKRFSYTTSTENSTSTLKMWSLERNCTAKCEPGCIIIGERTKLYACTSCCNKSFCNVGSASGELRPDNYILLCTSISIIMSVILNTLDVFKVDRSTLSVLCWVYKIKVTLKYKLS